MTNVNAFYRMALALSICIVYSTASSFGYPINHDNAKSIPGIILPGKYLVVGVFEHEENAKKYTEHVSEIGHSAEYAYYPQSGYYYVYTTMSPSTKKITDAYKDLRASREFNDAWVFVAKPQGATPSLTEAEPDSGWDESISDQGWEEAISDSRAETAKEEVTEQASAAEVENKRIELSKQDIMHVQFTSHRYETKEPVSSSVTIVEGARSKNIAQVSTGETTSIDKTTILDSVLQIIPYAIGYRKTQFDLPLYMAPSDSTGALASFNNDTLVMSFPLQRLEKGDTQIMFNTYFYGNSSVMRERSRYELDEVVKLLEEKSEMKIKLHGHTNGNGRGFIYVFSPEEKNFFRLIQNKEHKKKGVSSIKLSALRAETIKSYLEHRGISGDRIETEGWGGKKMLYPEDSPLSKNNIRVEIEVLDE